VCGNEQRALAEYLNKSSHVKTTSECALFMAFGFIRGGHGYPKLNFLWFRSVATSACHNINL